MTLYILIIFKNYIYNILLEEELFLIYYVTYISIYFNILYNIFKKYTHRKRIEMKGFIII